MIFRQLFEPLSSTYTYLLGCEETDLFEPDWAWALYLEKGATGVGQKQFALFSAWAVATYDCLFEGLGEVSHSAGNRSEVLALPV